jgi:hypothetical protein
VVVEMEEKRASRRSREEEEKRASRQSREEEEKRIAAGPRGGGTRGGAARS